MTRVAEILTRAEQLPGNQVGELWKDLGRVVSQADFTAPEQAAIVHGAVRAHFLESRFDDLDAEPAIREQYLDVLHTKVEYDAQSRHLLIEKAGSAATSQASLWRVKTHTHRIESMLTPEA